MSRNAALVVVLGLLALARGDTSLPAAPDGGSRVQASGASIIGRVVWKGAPQRASIPWCCDPACPRTILDPRLAFGKDGGVADTFIFVDGPPALTPVEPRSIVVDHRGCAIEPHVQVVGVGGTIALTNHDATLHNVHAYAMDAITREWLTVFNIAVVPGRKPIERHVDKSMTIILRCDIHPWESGLVRVTNSPSIAVTDQTGRFALRNLALGRYRIVALHEGWAPPLREPPASFTSSQPLVQLDQQVTVGRDLPEVIFSLGPQVQP